MSVMISADVQQRLDALLGTGQYASEEEILRAAVTALEERNADIAAIRNGIDDMENGRCVLLGEFEAEFREQNQIGEDE